MADQKSPACDGQGNCYGDHCCYVNGSPCPYLLVDDPAYPGRKYACGLLKELGNWTRVHRDPRYKNDVQPHWQATGTADCGDWPGDPQAIRAAIIAGTMSPEFGCCMTRDLFTGTWPPPLPGNGNAGGNGGNPNKSE